VYRNDRKLHAPPPLPLRPKLLFYSFPPPWGRSQMSVTVGCKLQHEALHEKRK
jgi:hypothetical protein